MDEDMKNEVPSDVVELIIAVDLNPSDPEEPINVNDVKVSPKGEGGEDGGDDWKGLVTQLLMGDPASGITSDDISFEMAKDAVSRVLEGDSGEDMDPFSKASMSEPRKPEAPSKPKKKGGGGMKAALDRALGGKPGEPGDEDEDEDEDEKEKKDEDKGNPFAKRG